MGVVPLDGLGELDARQDEVLRHGSGLLAAALVLDVLERDLCALGLCLASVEGLDAALDLLDPRLLYARIGRSAVQALDDLPRETGTLREG